jgi:acetyltransferase-like isoleucine patch superfamily enzyme
MPTIEHNALTENNYLVHYPDRLELAPYVDISVFVWINAANGVTIEKDVQIGPFTSIMSNSTIDGKSGEVVIESGALVGSHSTVMPGVTIGTNALVGSHSFVTDDVPPGSLAYGTPAKVVSDNWRKSQPES